MKFHIPKEKNCDVFLLINELFPSLYNKHGCQIDKASNRQILLKKIVIGLHGNHKRKKSSKNYSGTFNQSDRILKSKQLQLLSFKSSM